MTINEYKPNPYEALEDHLGYLGVPGDILSVVFVDELIDTKKPITLDQAKLIGAHFVPAHIAQNVPESVAADVCGGIVSERQALLYAQPQWASALSNGEENVA